MWQGTIVLFGLLISKTFSQNMRSVVCCAQKSPAVGDFDVATVVLSVEFRKSYEAVAVLQN